MSTTTTTPATILECIDGKDDHLKLEIGEGQKMMLGCDADHMATPLQEMGTECGYIIVQNQNGILQVDATACSLLVKINGLITKTGTVKLTDVLRIGGSIWKTSMAHTEDAATDKDDNISRVRHGFTNLIGLEELQDFKLKNIFAEVFRKHTLPEMEDQLVTGTFNNTPALTDIETNWARPWLFARMLLVSVIAAFLLIIGFRLFQNANLIPGIIFVGSFAVPISTLIFFLEMNTPRNISIFMTMLLTFMGGVASLLVTLVFFNNFDFFSNTIGASSAGIIEETAKLLCVILIMGKFHRYKWILNGLLFGATIGTGFAAFESAGYAFNAMLGSNSVDVGVNNIILRGVLAPFGHIIWTGNAAAALWLVKGDRKFDWSMVKDMRFLRVFLSSMILHMIWNAPFGIIPLPFVGDVKYAILGVIGWMITFRLIQAGLKQLNEARHTEVESLRAN